LDALQQVITVVGLPMFTLMFLAGISFIIALRKERLQFVTKVRGIPEEAVFAGREALNRGEGTGELPVTEQEEEGSTAGTRTRSGLLPPRAAAGSPAAPRSPAAPVPTA